MKLIISSVSGKPIYEQIKSQIRDAVLSGELQPGDPLPSLRTLARELRISVLTVTRSYNELADEGIVENRQGKGSFVAERGGERMRLNLVQQVEDQLDQTVKVAIEAGIGLPELTESLQQAYRERSAAK
ncbi:GntR family transcriptional regulator [Bifidobacterium bombi]|uniref:Transcriptional regulator, GntR family n=1 Tax=Bifidobacterium bombi DSM 19703 TaxID=1341695 RepID=A0A080N258_9BIFI|nr:GntR family transcriptional regulator [Bifidobacterium bombi]KFF30821.1 transcriptional regulator, GntR family [Bifidobacterium bombi DSM 19703]